MGGAPRPSWPGGSARNFSGEGARFYAAPPGPLFSAATSCSHRLRFGTLSTGLRGSASSSGRRSGNLNAASFFASRLRLRRAYSESGLTMTALATEIGLTVARVSQLIARAERQRQKA